MQSEFGLCQLFLSKLEIHASEAVVSHRIVRLQVDALFQKLSRPGVVLFAIHQASKLEVGVRQVSLESDCFLEKSAGFPRVVIPLGHA